MKKKKISVLFNISTICLALVAIVVGIYSINQAKVDINGSLGFTAHYVSATVSLSLTGSAETSGGAQQTKTYNNLASFTKTEDTTTKTFNLGTRYFTSTGVNNVNEYPAPIKAEFTINNTSSLPIKVTINLPDAMSNIDMYANKEAIIIDKNNQGKIMVTFSVKDPLTNVSTISFKNFNMTLEPCMYSKSDIVVYYDETTTKPSNYYIKYGTSGDSDLKWYIIGTQGSDGVLKVLSPSDDFSTTLSTDNTSGRILKDDASTTYVFLAESTLTGTNGVIYNNRGYKNTDDDKYYNLYYDYVKANDYATSTIRDYLNGKTINNKIVKSGTALAPTKWQPNETEPNNINFFTQNTLKDSSTTVYNNIYALIKTRSLKYLYQDVDEDAFVNDTETSLLDYTDGILETDADAFWLLSINEANTLITTAPKRDSADAMSWWLRNTTNSSQSDIVGAVIIGGSIGANANFSRVHYNQDGSIKLGARPAFLI